MYRVIRGYSKFMAMIETISIILLFLFMGIMVIVMIYQVVLRYVFHNGTIWAEELARLLFIWASLFGAAVAVRRQTHLRVDFVVNLFHGRSREVVEAVTYVICIAFLGYLLPLAMQLCMSTTNNTTAALRIPLGYVYSCIPIGTVLMILMLIEQILLVLGHQKAIPVKLFRKRKSV